MAKTNTKKMMKELVNNGYVSKGENLSDAEIKKLYEQMIADEAAVKEEISMKQETNNAQATINNTEIKEECPMMTLQELVNALTNNQKVQDAGYIDRDTLRDILNNKESFNMGFNNRTTRKEMVAVVMRMYKDSIRVADEIAYGNIESDATHQVICTDHAAYDDEFIAFKGTKEQCEEYAEIHNYIDGETGIASYKVESADVSVGDLDITHDNVTIEDMDIEYVQKEEHVAPANYNNNARAKTDKLFALIKACAADNQKKGFGYTISSFMLQACILNAGAGVEKFKGHTVTSEEAEMTKTVYHWLLNNNIIKPVVYSVKEDDKVRVYMPEYPGKTNTKNVKMIPYNKSAGYNAKKITSFLICFK